MALYISVVNHNHDYMIASSLTLAELAKEHCVIVKSNTPATKQLSEYCLQNQINLIQGTHRKGFAANNNEVFQYSCSKLGMQAGDYFLVLNPDVEVTLTTVNQLLKDVLCDSVPIAAINLFLDNDFTQYDNSVRRFPTILNPLKSLIGIKRTDNYDKSKIREPKAIDWAAGSFLLFKKNVYSSLKGFDERYYMYYEDVDLCKRANEKGYDVVYYPKYKAIHRAQHANRRVLSRQFFHYVRSIVIYFIRR